MKVKRLFLFGLLITTEILNAQTDFKPGYIINQANDTISGEIDYRGDLLMSQICRFKGADKTITEYSPNEIIAYRFIDSKYYVSKKINGLEVFMEYLIQGKVNIYYMRDKSGEDHYYISKEGTDLAEIPYQKGIKEVDNRNLFYETTKHIGVLSVFMQDAPELRSEIMQMKEPQHKNLIQLAEDYHNAVCKDEQCIIVEKKLPLFSLSVEPTFGIIKYVYFTKNKIVNEFGGNLYIWAPRTNEKLYFKTGIQYSNLEEPDDSLQLFKVPFQIQYMYPAYKLQPKASLGVNFWNAKYNGSRSLTYTIALNAGVNYKIHKSVSLSATVNSEYLPFSMSFFDEEQTMKMISYSLNLGLYIKL